MDDGAFAETLRQIALGNAGAIAKNDGIDEQAIVRSRPADMAHAAGQEVFDRIPFVVAQGVAMHP